MKNASQRKNGRRKCACNFLKVIFKFRIILKLNNYKKGNS